MKIAFVSMCNLYLCPYIKQYLIALGGQVSYDMIYWDRYETDEPDYGARTVYRYCQRMDETISRARKFRPMLGFAKYAAQQLRREAYDGIILLHTNAAVLLHSLLCNEYDHRFVLDIRDYSMEKNPIYYALEKRLVAHSAINFISSPGYQAFLPKHTYYMVHNSTHLEPEVVSKFREERSRKAPIHISFIGLIRFFEQNRRIADIFGNDHRFVLQYFGASAEKLQAQLPAYTNLLFEGQFPPEKTLAYYRRTDIINNAYGNNDLSLDYAYSNKLYYATSLGLPILVSPGTYMEEITGKYGIGFVLDLNDPQIADKLFCFWQEIDWEAFDRSCDSFRRMVEEDEQQFYTQIKSFISKSAV